MGVHIDDTSSSHPMLCLFFHYGNTEPPFIPSTKGLREPPSPHCYCEAVAAATERSLSLFPSHSSLYCSWRLYLSHSPILSSIVHKSLVLMFGLSLFSYISSFCCFRFVFFLFFRFLLFLFSLLNSPPRPSDDL